MLLKLDARYWQALIAEQWAEELRMLGTVYLEVVPGFSVEFGRMHLLL